MSKLRLGSEYIPLTDEDMSKIRVIIPFTKVAWLTVSIPFLAFIFCIIWSVLYNFEHSTSTHCQVYNILPSVSATIGHYRPQRDVWKTAIAVQAIVRIIIFKIYQRYYKEHVYKWAQYLSNIALVIYAIENISLVTLSFWTSNDNYAIHKLSFITFLIMSFIHMILVYFIMKSCRNVMKDWFEITSLKWKRRLIMLNIFSILASGYFFYRHNKYCEPLVYSMFALSEYGVVLSNMGFHTTVTLDFPITRFMISGSGFKII